MAMIEIRAFLKPTITTADETIIKSVTKSDNPRFISDFCSRYKASMWMPPREAPEFRTKLTPIPIKSPAITAAITGVIVGKRTKSIKSDITDIRNIHKKVDNEKVQPSFLIERIKKGRFTIKKRIPHDHSVMKVPSVATPAVPPKVKECTVNSLIPAAVKNNPKIIIILL